MISKFLKISLFCLAGFGALLPLASFSKAQTAQYDEAKVKKIESYFNQLKTMKAYFFQMNPNGSLSEGKFFISRPGKMRIQYEWPKDKLIIADGTWFIYYDEPMDEVSYIPLDSSPANIILKEKVNFSEDVDISDFSEKGPDVKLTLVKKEEPEAGKLTLVFSKKPFQLKQWVIVDAQGLETTVNIEQVQTNVPLEKSLFVFERMSF
jgi:outer membrane lipoprotein-sorting protein